MNQKARTPNVKTRQLTSALLKELKRIHLYILPVLWALFNIYCVIWITLTSLKTNRELATNPWGLPEAPQFENYTRAWESANLGLAFRNSVIVTGASVLLILVFCAPAAYALSRFKFKGSGWLTALFIAGAGVPAAMLIIPLFGLTQNLGLNDSLPGLILIYSVVSIPFTMFVLTGFYSTLPSEFEEAARIDGCTEFGVFWRVMLPLVSPGLITVAIFNFVTIWNEYALALVFLQDPEKLPLARALYGITSSMQYTGDWASLFAAVVIVMVPSLAVYALLSERLIEGITAGALK